MPSTTPIPAPPATEPLIGLLASITPYKGDDRWMNPEAVISYRPEGCNELGGPDDMCSPADNEFGAGPDTVTWKPYSLSVSERCSTLSGELTEASRARIKRLMLADTERQLGFEFWDGDLAQTATLPDTEPYPNTWLANVADVDILTESGPATLSHGMACLDQYLASNNSGQQGAIHATIQTLNQWVTLRVVEHVNGKWYSPGGNLVIASPGYTGTDPNGNAGDNNIWAYATDMPRLFIGPVLVDPVMSSIDWRNNTVEALARRPALAEFQRCRHAGVRLAIEGCDSGGS